MLHSTSEEENDVKFYESLDRILSSSNSSTSSESESDNNSNLFSFDVWTHQPDSSIHDRRQRLLHHMGLSSDPSLSRQTTTTPTINPPPQQKPKAVVASRPEESDIERRRCTIRNLDNGKEFIVKEFQEDGIWKKNLKEVQTGRCLTMEEFEICVGRSPIVQELMRRQEFSDSSPYREVSEKRSRSWKKKRRNWFRRDSYRSESTTDDSTDGQQKHGGPERTKVRHCGKPRKELTGLFMSQEVNAHSGSIWSVKFSLDGRYLASAGEDCEIHVWEVAERGDGKGGGLVSSGSEPVLSLACVEGGHWEKMRRVKLAGLRRSVSSDQLMLPEYVFALSEKPVCTFRGHLEDVLDLSWSKSQFLLSSSMDKTVKLWHLSSESCLKTFSHSDYVTCIQFNPVDDRYFISGSLDNKVRIWSIPDRQVVDWNDLHEMVTAACYTPNGQGALVGSHKGSCHLFNTSENKLLQKSQIDLQNKKRRSGHKKITGFEFAPGSSSEVLITSADSRIRVIDGVELVHKFKGFRNTSSQISACLTANGKYVICASEDSHVYVWRYDATDFRPNRSRGVVSVSKSYEHFHCQDVTVAVPWPSTSMGGVARSMSRKANGVTAVLKANGQVPSDSNVHDASLFRQFKCSSPPQNGGIFNTSNCHFGDRASATWPEEKLLIATRKNNSQSSGVFCNGGLTLPSRPAWGMVIVTAGRGGQIRIFQNFGFPVYT